MRNFATFFLSCSPKKSACIILKTKLHFCCKYLYFSVYAAIVSSGPNSVARFRADAHSEAVLAALAKHKTKRIPVLPMPVKRRSLMAHGVEADVESSGKFGQVRINGVFRLFFLPRRAAKEWRACVQQGSTAKKLVTCFLKHRRPQRGLSFGLCRIRRRFEWMRAAHQERRNVIVGFVA